MRDKNKISVTPWASPTRRQMVVGIGVTMLLGACSDDDDDPGNIGSPTPMPTPSPSPTPTPATAFVGAVYSATNKIAGNTIVAFGRNPDGTLAPIGEYATGGNGGVFDGTNDGLDPLITEDAVVVVDDRFLLVVNAGSDTISSLAINPDFTLSLVGMAATGGVGPNSIAYHGGLVYVANEDSDGTPDAPPAQQGNVTGFRFDPATGALTPIAGSTRELTNRPSNIELSPDGNFLVVSAWNAGSLMLPASDGEDSLVVYRVNADGTLSSAIVGNATSTSRGNSAGRNLPAVIGFEVVQARGGRTVVIASEAREFLASGDPAKLGQFQTASVSSWQLMGDGSLSPLSTDVLTGPVIKTGTDSPTSACWISVSPDRKYFWVSHASGSVISTFALNMDGTIALLDGRDVAGTAADPNAADPLANADGFLDITVSGDGKYVYLLLGLKGSIHVHSVANTGALTFIQQTTGLLPMKNAIGLVSVDAIAG